MASIIRLCLLVCVSWISYAEAEQCQSSVYCNVNGIKYMSMKSLRGIRLNTTAIKVNQTKNISSCQTLCLRENGCFSININISKKEEYGCHLLSTNQYSDFHLMVKDEKFVHLYIMSPCNDLPCKSNEKCVPNYTNDSYTCASHNIRRFKKPVSIVTADYYWPFDSVSNARTPGKSGTKSDLTSIQMTVQNTVNILPVPGRPTPVAYCKMDGSTPNCLTLTGNVKCIIDFNNCKFGATYSIWLRFTREVLERKQAARILRVHDNLMGIKFDKEADKANGYTFTIIPKPDTYCTVKFGENIDAGKWTNFVITYSTSNRICGFVDGVLKRCSKSWSPTNGIFAPATSLMLKVSRGKVFLDDFAVWTTPLTSQQVKELYAMSKA